MRLGILTTGGDVPALNSAIRAVSLAAYQAGHELIGIENATEGLAAGTYRVLNPNTCSINGYDPMMTIGGTVLGSFTTEYVNYTDEDIIRGYHELGIDCLIAIGGDGGLALIDRLATLGGWNVVGIPKTIDNDVPYTRSIGFDTAINTVVDCVDRLKQTAASHNRYMVVETMGRTAGHLALHAGIASGVDAILLPERRNSILDLVMHMRKLSKELCRKSGIIMVAEGCKFGGNPSKQADQVSFDIKMLDVERQFDLRTCVLGHIQRGGQPSAFDRLLATSMGQYAVKLASEGSYGQMVRWADSKATSIGLRLAVKYGPSLVAVDNPHFELAKNIGIFI